MEELLSEKQRKWLIFFILICTLINIIGILFNLEQQFKNGHKPPNGGDNRSHDCNDIVPPSIKPVDTLQGDTCFHVIPRPGNIPTKFNKTGSLHCPHQVMNPGISFVFIPVIKIIYNNWPGTLFQCPKDPDSIICVFNNPGIGFHTAYVLKV